MKTSRWNGLFCMLAALCFAGRAAAVVENVPNGSPVSDVSFYVRLRMTLGGLI